MKTINYIYFFLIGLLFSCNEGVENLFDKSADERSTEAIESLRQELTSTAWKVLYQPEETSGAFWVLLNFSGNGNVTIKSDLGANNGEFYEQTITYRIDSSLGLELIFESYSMFSYLFEQYAATFQAEYEFKFVNKTPDNTLVFTSKTDFGVKTIFQLLPATPADESLLGKSVSEKLNQMANDLNKFSSSVKLTYQNKDLMLFLSLNEITRNITFTTASRKSNTTTLQQINFETAYFIKGDSLILKSSLSGNYFGNNIQVKSIKFNTITQNSFNGCANPITLHQVSGKTSQNDDVTIETALKDLSGRLFAQESNFYFAPLVYVFNNGQSVGDEIAQNIEGAVEMHMYYNISFGGNPFYAIGVVIRNPDNSVTFALREFTPTLIDNNLIFNFKPDITIFESPTQANVNNLNIYLNALADGDNTFVFKLGDGIYEFHNPCTGWSFVFIDANQ